MHRSSILTFNFNGYDTFHSHFYTAGLDYVLVTDDISHNLNSWDIKYPDKLKGLSPWEQSLYVRYHPFEFVNSKVAIVIDGSMVICEGIIELNKLFVDSEYEVAMPLSHMPLCKERVSSWYVRSRISHAEKHILIKYLKDNNAFDYNGCLAGAVKLIKKTDETVKWLHRTWELLYSLNDNDSPIRLDEVIATITLRKEFQHIKFAPLSTNVMNGEAFYYTYHKTGCCRLLPIAYPPHLDNVIATPWHIGKEYRHTYKYKCEAMCLTRYFEEQGLVEWIEHHLSIGFDHLHIFDNESSYPCREICSRYGNSVSYELITGNAKHYAIFNDYINSDRCHAEWVIPIDDDEYFELNPKFKNVNECLNWYLAKFPYSHMFAIRWKHLFPKIFHSDCTGNILSYCTEENHRIAATFQKMGDMGIKTFVHRYGKIYYETTEENPSGGHVPKHSAATYALLYNGEKITRCSCQRIPDGVGEPARLIHCRYKGYQWYKNKTKDIVDTNRELDNNSGKPYTHSYKFNDILDTLP